MYTEGKIGNRDKEQDRKWDEKEKEEDKDGGHKSRKETTLKRQLKERYPWGWLCL